MPRKRKAQAQGLPVGELITARADHDRDRAAAALGVDVNTPLPEYEPTVARMPRCPKCGAARTWPEMVRGRLYAWTCLACGWEGAWFRRLTLRPAPNTISAWEEAHAYA